MQGSHIPNNPIFGAYCEVISQGRVQGKSTHAQLSRVDQFERTGVQKAIIDGEDDTVRPNGGYLALLRTIYCWLLER